MILGRIGVGAFGVGMDALGRDQSKCAVTMSNAEAIRRIEKAIAENATSLDLSRLELTSVPTELCQLQSLSRLYLSDNQLTRLPAELCQLQGLRLLFISGNQLTSVPAELGQLQSLNELSLRSNQLTSVPAELGKLQSLNELSLRSNQLTSLPAELGQLQSLSKLYLRSNQLTSLPVELGQLQSLNELSLSNNRLTSVPAELCQLQSLRLLYLSYNQLTSVPAELGQLLSLSRLYLSYNQLTSVPAELGQLKSLSELDLSSNQLTSVPAELGQLKSLSELSLSSNQLTSVPAELRQLQSLSKLYLHSNQLTSVPAELGQLKSLSELSLNDNPLNPILLAAYEQGLRAFTSYLQAQADSQIILNEAKLIFIGEGEVGKTSLLSALRGDPWVENRQTTHGIEVDIKSLIVTDPDSKKEITLNGWDFGGQNIYRHTHQLFFTAPAIYLAVWNPRRGPEQCRVDEWIKMVKHRAYDESDPNAKPLILVVATHGGPKERIDHIDEQALRNEFGDLIVGFHHVDSATELKLPELKQDIAQIAARIPQVGRTVPASWQNVLDALCFKRETSPWITYKQFQSLCSGEEVDLHLADIYAAILNELGHLIYYPTDPVLKDVIILKPEWLSKAISFVLEDKQVKNNNGLVRHRHLSELWDDPARGSDRYPTQLHPVFIKLMERFDLSYQVEFPDCDSEMTSLIAQLVPSQRPDNWGESWILKPDDIERTQVYRMLDKETGRSVEVEGLMYRLIVRLHRYSLGRQNYNTSRHWKQGLMLDNDYDGKAFIEDIDGDIHVTVRAAYPNSFLGYLCCEIEGLVKSFWKGIDPRLFIPCPLETCKGLLERDEILEFKSQGMPKVRCPVCRTFHDIDGLMATSATKPEWEEAVTELKQGQQQILKASVNGFDDMSSQLKILMSQTNEQYKILLTILNDPAKDGPRLFSFEPVDPSFWDKPTWIAQKFRLTLWCEHRRVPLPALNQDGDTSGIYELNITREWLKRASPFLRILSITLKLALPIAIPGTKLETDETEYNAIAEQLDFGVKSASSLLSGSEKVGDWLVEGDATDLNYRSSETIEAIRAQGSVLRELHALLKEQDPANGFGGLEKVINKRGESLWVHPQFVKEY